MSSANAQDYEPRPDPSISTNNTNPNGAQNVTDVDYEPHPEAQKMHVSPAHQHIIDSITRLYSGSASESDMRVYAEDAIYDDPWSYCDTRYKIAGQWYGIPKIFSPSQTLKTEVVEDNEGRIVWKQQQEYTLKGIKLGKKVDSLVSVALDAEGKVKYHKDMWNRKDYSHEGIGKAMKTLNGDHLTKITQPPKSL